MLEELERRNYTQATIRHYLSFVEGFARHFGKSPDKLGPDHLRSYQAYLLKERKLCPGTVKNYVAALRFFFVRTLHRHEFREFLPYPNARKKLPNILSQEEVACLINASSSLFQRTLLMVLYGTGMRRSELARVKIAHIDSQRMIIHVVDGKGHKDRDLPLSPTLLENLRVYWRRLKPPHLPVPVTTASRSRATHQRQGRMGGVHRSGQQGRPSQVSQPAPGSPFMGHASARSRYRPAHHPAFARP